MKSLKVLISMTLFALASVAPTSVVAQATAGGGKMGERKMEQSPASEMTDGEVRKVDNDAKKITIRHSAIKNLDMPPMTMVFQVKDPALIASVQKGDKVKFKVEMSGSAMVITEMQVSQ